MTTPAGHEHPSNTGPGRRLLIATAVAHHAAYPAWDRPGLIDARRDVVSLFTRELGYEDVGVLGLNPTQAQLTTELRRFSRSAQVGPQDMLAIYLGCHGEILDDGEHVLVTADTDPDDLNDALPTAELARKVLKGTRVRRLLLMLDACYSGRGGNELAAAALKRMTERWAPDEGSGLVVVTSALPADQAQVGAFPALMRDAVDSVAVAGHAPPHLALDAVVAAMNANSRRPGFQHIGVTAAGLTGHVPPFLPNPRHDSALTGVDLAIQQAAEWRAQTEQGELTYRATLLRRAMGSHDAPGGGWWFSGRHTALLEITQWLDVPHPTSPLLAVTGDPGSGKTAVLGLIATLTHPERRHTVPLDSLRLPAAAVPAADAVDATVYAQDLTTEQVLRRIAAAARVEAATPGQLLNRLGDRSRPFTVLLDGLDEAAAPHDLAGQVLGPLAEHARGRLRLLVGTRPHLLAHLVPGLDRTAAVDLDDDRYADREAMTTYALRGLLGATVDSAYRELPPPRVRAVAEAVARAAHPSFLVARITAATLAAQAPVTDPTDPVWLAELPRLPGDAMRRDLDTRLGADAARARDLLLPLAFAQGEGLPWEDLWALLASRLAGYSYTDEDLLWLYRHAGSYIVENTQDDRSLYRLYHQALVEHLRDGTDTRQVNSVFVDALLDRVPLTVDTLRADWAHTHPYTRRHLATHAVQAGRLDQIVADADYLVHADPDTLLPALQTTTSDIGRTVRSLYRTTAPQHRRLDPPARRQVLALTAARLHLDTLLRELAAPLRWQPRWVTGAPVSTALYYTLHHAADSVACIDVQGQPVMVACGLTSSAWVGDLVTGTMRATLYAWHGSVTVLACTRLDDRAVAVTGTSFGAVQVWDLATGELLSTLTDEDLSVVRKFRVTAVACTRFDDRAVAVTGTSFGAVQVWDLTTGEVLRTVTGHLGTVTAVACTRLDDRAVAITGTSFGAVQVWDLATGELLATLIDGNPSVPAGRKLPVTAVACARLDDRLVVVASVHRRDRTRGRRDPEGVWVWDLATGELLTTLTDGNPPAAAVACTRIDDRAVAVVGTSRGAVQVWDLDSGGLRTTLTGHQGVVRAVACTRIENRPTAVTTDGQVVRVWDLSDSEDPVDQRSGWAPPRLVACTQVGRRPVAVTCVSGGTVQVWDLATGEQVATLAVHRDAVAAMACTRIEDRAVVVTGTSRGAVQVWDLGCGELVTTLTTESDSVTAMACTRIEDRPVAVTGTFTGAGGVVQVWDVTAGELVTSLTTEIASVAAVACTRIDDRPVVVAFPHSARHGVRVWDLATGEPRATLTGHQGKVKTVACTRLDGRPIAVIGNSVGRAQVLDLTTGEVLASLIGGDLSGTTSRHPRVNAVVCTQVEDRPVAVTGASRTSGGVVQVWDLVTGVGEVIARPSGPARLAVGPGGEIVMATSEELVVLDLRRY